MKTQPLTGLFPGAAIACGVQNTASYPRGKSSEPIIKRIESINAAICLRGFIRNPEETKKRLSRDAITVEGMKGYSI
jgi:hypothetical protein